MKFIIPILLLLLVGCPGPPEDLDSIVCDEGYYPCGTDLQRCCPDTTSHDFAWEFDTLGILGSKLYDAAIISDDDIWLAGQLRVEEPDDQGILTTKWYNAVHWDGNEWSLHEAVDHSILYGVFAFGSDDVWFVSGLSILHYDGSNFEKMYELNLGEGGSSQIVTLWGSSPSNIYFAGYNGTTVHYDGSTFIRYDTRIDTDFIDIIGTADGQHVYIIGNPVLRPGQDVVLHSSDSPYSWEEINYPSLPNLENEPLEANSAYIAGEKLYISKKYELWEYNIFTRVSKFIIEIDHIYEVYNFIEAETENDVFFGGSKFDYIHYNGVSYQYVDAVQQKYTSIIMRGGDFKKNTAIMVGSYDLNLWSGAALVALGRRN